ncbi:hypothetical protein [Amycolatopsis thailandensis]|uniref:hypothetical protein n=1 Tax=Amycolatopsis thailandensis TaxID=589330 RepID=UPI001178B98B|nr:hypothetical protein [Amycolatopsis thailandensis]
MSELNAGRADRDEGIEAVLAADVAVHRGNRDRVDRAVAKLIRSKVPFNADHVDRAVMAEDPSPYSRLLIAASMLAAARRGEIDELFDRRPAASTRRSRHGAKLRWWVCASGQEAA